MAHNRQDIKNFHIGQKATLVINVEDENGDAVNMTGGEAVLTVMPKDDFGKKTSNVDALLQKSVGQGIEITDPSAGKLEVTFEPSDTEDLKHITRWYRIDVTDSEDNPMPGAVAGNFELVHN